MLVPAHEKASCLKKNVSPHPNSNKENKSPRQKSLDLLQPRGNRAGASAGTATRSSQSSASVRTSKAAPEPCKAPQSRPRLGPYRQLLTPRLLLPAVSLLRPPAPKAPPTSPPRPALRRRQRARARAGSRLVPLPSVRAPHAQSAPAVSVCLNRKADILVPLGPPRPTPQAFAAATRPFPSWDRSPSQELPHQQPPGPNYRLPLRPLSCLSSAKSPSGIDLALPHRTP